MAQITQTENGVQVIYYEVIEWGIHNATQPIILQ
jgi:hypothetical protein